MEAERQHEFMGSRAWSLDTFKLKVILKNIAKVHDIIEGDRCLTVVELHQELGISYGSVQIIIENELQFREFLPGGYQNF